MKKNKAHKAQQLAQGRRHKLQQQLRQVRRRRTVTGVLLALTMTGLLLAAYYRDVPSWLYLVVPLMLLLLVMDTVYLKHLRTQLNHPG